MSETAEEQRQRLNRKRIAEVDDILIKCLECDLSFVRVGSHVVQVHGYENAMEYRRAHGLMARETVAPNYKKMMQEKLDPKVIKNLKKGASNRFTKNGGHAEAVREFWKVRRDGGIHK